MGMVFKKYTLADLEKELEEISDHIASLRNNLEDVIEDEGQKRFEEAKDDLRAEIEDELTAKE